MAAWIIFGPAQPNFRKTPRRSKSTELFISLFLQLMMPRSFLLGGVRLDQLFLSQAKAAGLRPDVEMPIGASPQPQTSAGPQLFSCRNDKLLGVMASLLFFA